MYPLVKINLKYFLAVLILSIGYFNDVRAQSPAAPAANQLVLPVAENQIKLIWMGDTVNNQWDTYASLLIPVRIGVCPKLFYMQFDLGAPNSFFYQHKVQAIRLKYPGGLSLNDSCSKLSNLQFTAGHEKILAKEIGLRNFGDSTVNWSDKKGVEIIGTLGEDFIENKTVVINYPLQTLSIGNEIPEKLKMVTLSNFMLIRGSVLLPAKIKGKQSMIYFDTGSSAYELLTSKETSEALAQSNVTPARYSVKSWGKTLTANTVLTSDSITMGGQIIPIKKATYIEGASDSQVQQMLKLGIGGMTGNKLFLNYILIIDTRNKKFGLVAQKH